MGTKQQTTQTNQFSQTGMGAYNAAQPLIQSALSYYLGPQGDPTNSSYFRSALGLGGKQVAQQGATNISNTFQRGAGDFGGANLAGYQNAMLSAASRGNSALSARNYWDALQGSTGVQLNALRQAADIRPLQTGQTQVQQTSGLGTWLPQLLAALGSGAMSMGTGGLSNLLHLGGGVPGGASPGTMSVMAGANAFGGMTPSLFAPPNPYGN